MFSDKNYGLPKDLIEAAKRVHEKQLEEQQKPTSLEQAVERVGLAIRGVIPRKATKPSAKDVYKAMSGTEPEPKRAKKPQSEEVQFTEEELAEAFAIFLEENFHVEMLTEEDLDYVFENEFPQWLEEKAAQMRRDSREEQRKRAAAASNPTPPPKRKRWTLEGYHSRLRKQPFYRDATAKAIQSDTGGPGETGVGDTAKAIQSDTGGPGETGVGDKTAKAPASTDRNQVRVSAKPDVSSRKQTGGPSLFQQAKRAVRPTPGDSGRTATDRLKYMARRGNKASQQALRGPKKDWRASVFNPDGN